MKKIGILLASLVFVVALSGTAKAATITSCGIVTENSVLASNLSSIGQPSCLTIGANNIVLDCAGHSITGDGTGYGIYLLYKSGVTIKNCVVEGFHSGIRSAVGSNYNTFINNTINNNIFGILMTFSSNTVVTNNITNNNQFGIFVFQNANYNTFTNNIANNNFLYGIYSASNFNNTFINNTLSNNGSFGIYFLHSDNNKIYNNNFIDNIHQASVPFSIGNIFNLDSPTGGNYWSDYDTPGEGCNDENNDGFCDAPYYFYYGGYGYGGDGGVDHLPWSRQNGWLDSDGDGILDEVDTCPYEDATGYDVNLDGCIDRVEDLPGIVEGLNLEEGIETSLVSKIENAIQSLEKGNQGAAINKLEAFINQVEALKGKKILVEDAEMLIEYAESIITQIGG